MSAHLKPPIYPAMDSAINDLPKNLVIIGYRGRKDYFNIKCPENFRVMECDMNKNKIDVSNNSCTFFFPREGTWNSDISFICNNWKLGLYSKQKQIFKGQTV